MYTHKTIVLFILFEVPIYTFAVFAKEAKNLRIIYILHEIANASYKFIYYMFEKKKLIESSLLCPKEVRVAILKVIF